MSGKRYGDGSAGGERRLGDRRPSGRRRAPVGGPRRDRGSNGSLAAFLLGVAVVAGLIGFTLNRMTTGNDEAPVASATPSVSHSATADPLAGLTAEQVAIRLLDAKVPLRTTVVYDASNDPNQLLGKPGGYTSKIAFVDTRTHVSPASVTTKDPVAQGGSIEVFADPAAASSRVQQLRAVSSSSQLLQEFDYQQGGVVVRVSKYLSEAQAKGYQDALAALAAPAASASASASASAQT